MTLLGKEINVVLRDTLKYNSTGCGKELVFKINYITDNSVKEIRETMDDLLERLKLQTPSEDNEYYPWSYVTNRNGIPVSGYFQAYPDDGIQATRFEPFRNWLLDQITQWCMAHEYIINSVKYDKQAEYWMKININI